MTLLAALGTVGCGDAKRRPGFAPAAKPVTATPAPAAAPAAPRPAAPTSSGTSAPTATTAPGSPDTGVASSTSSEGGVSEGVATLTLDEIVNSEVVYEDLTPGVVLEVEPEGKPSLTSAVFSYGSGKTLSLDVAFEKTTLWKDRPNGLATNARWVLEDSKSGLKLAEGTFSLPALCECEVGKDHVEGDVRIPHATSFTLDLPRHRDNETLRIFDAAGKELDVYSLDLNQK